jgi:hypothetical protein
MKKIITINMKKEAEIMKVFQKSQKVYIKCLWTEKIGVTLEACRRLRHC